MLISTTEQFSILLYQQFCTNSAPIIKKKEFLSFPVLYFNYKVKQLNYTKKYDRNL